MLGSFQDAEDAVQDLLLSAWRGLASFDRRASIRTCLYRIATNRCLDLLRSASRRPATEWNVAEVEPPEPSRLGEIVWLEPYPDELFAAPLSPEARYEQSEAISLAFITALQLLPARQRAVLILRDVLGYRASEVAEMLESSVESVTSALKRARASLQRRMLSPDEQQPPPSPKSPAEKALVDRFVRAYESADIDGLIALLTENAIVSMPPVPLEYRGRDAVARFLTSLLGNGRRYHLVPTRSNGQQAFGAYVRGKTDGIRHGAGLLVLTLSGDRISALTRFDHNALAWFGLPASLP
jgi:RNA polymerase sigma-70 factor (ECF subfamily)